MLRGKIDKMGVIMTSPVRVAVVGSINMDLVVNSPRMPAPGETRIGTSFVTVPGGKGANQAVAAARLGARVDMIGCVGDDAFGRVLRTGLEREGIATAHVHVAGGASSGVALIQVDQAGENAITVVPGANGRLDTGHLQHAKAVLTSADVVLLQLEIPHPTVSAVIAICRSAGVKTILDPAPAPDADPPEMFWRADVVSPNQHEAEALSGVRVTDMDSAVRAARILQDRGVQNVVIKLGARGALMLDAGGRTEMVPAFDAPVVDTTAAGDAFTAALGWGLASGMSMVQATRFGCAAGSLAVQRAGAQDAMPDREAVAGVLAA